MKKTKWYKGVALLVLASFLSIGFMSCKDPGQSLNKVKKTETEEKKAEDVKKPEENKPSEKPEKPSYNFITVKYSDLDKWLKDAASLTKVNYINITEIPKNALNASSSYPYSSELAEKFNKYPRLLFIRLNLKDNEKITEIPNYAFRETENLVGIELPADITSIGNSAFYECRKLVELDFSRCAKLEQIGKNSFYNCAFLGLDLPSNLKSIGDEAFSDCKSLVSIKLPATLNSIGAGAFNSCSDLSKIEIDKANSSYIFDSNSKVLFNKNKTELLLYLGKTGSDVEYEAPNTLTKIADSAFARKELKKVDFSKCSNLTSIGNDAFISARIKVIDFSSCTKLSSIGEYAFYEASSSSSDGTKIDLSGCTGLTSIGKKAFRGADHKVINLTNCTNITSIEDNAFSSCKFTEIDLSACTKLSSIKEDAFKYCRKSTVTLPKGITEIVNGAFGSKADNNACKEVKVPNNDSDAVKNLLTDSGYDGTITPYAAP